VIRGSNIESLDCFIHLFEVKATKNLYAYAFGEYAVAIHGLHAL
jgi:hypothetical protein